MHLSLRFRKACSEVHREAECHPFTMTLQGGHMSPAIYVAYLQMLAPVYQALEQLTDKYLPEFAALIDRYDLARYSRIQSDIAFFQNSLDVPINLSTKQNAYQDRILWLEERYPASVISHIYVRYLGDMMGGQIMARKVAQSYNLDTNGIQFFEFSHPSGPREIAQAIKSQIDDYGQSHPDSCDQLVLECLEGFRLTCRLFDAVMESEKNHAPSTKHSPHAQDQDPTIKDRIAFTSS